ncbi:MAG: hypothetical protein JWP57_1059, partial [Spirosoma sp.]|nr:hypothetical protein [Spirosoma sp.]
KNLRKPQVAESGRLYNVKVVIVLGAQQKHIARSIAKGVIIHKMLTAPVSDKNDFVVAVLMNWMRPFSNGEMIYTEWLMLNITLHSLNVHKRRETYRQIVDFYHKWPASPLYF